MNVWNMLKRKRKDLRRSKTQEKVDGRVNKYIFTEKLFRYLRAKQISWR